MKDYAGIILVLVGVICLVVYYFAPVSNVLLVCGLLFEILGILAFLFFNRTLK